MSLRDWGAVAGLLFVLTLLLSEFCFGGTVTCRLRFNKSVII
jgi:hypothetical protein